MSIDKLAPADIAHFVPQWPVKANVSGTVNLRGPLSGAKGRFFSLGGGWLFSR